MLTRDKEKWNEYMRNYRLLHREQTSEWGRKFRQRHKEQGLCAHCNKQAIPGLTQCIQCWNRSRLQKEQYRQKNREALNTKVKEIRKRWREEGKCLRCGALLIEDESVYCMNCSMSIWRQYPSKVRGLYEVNYETIASKS